MQNAPEKLMKTPGVWLPFLGKHCGVQGRELKNVWRIPSTFPVLERLVKGACVDHKVSEGLPGGNSGWESSCQCRSAASTPGLGVFHMPRTNSARGPLLGATTGDPTYDKVMWKSHDEQGGSWLQRFPGSARASTPKPESVCLTILCLSPTLLTLTGGYPRPPFSGKSQLRALVNKSPGHDGSVSIQIPLMAF